MKQYPLRIHPFARAAAAAALAAHRQDRFWEYHAGLYRQTRNLNEETILSTARDLGLDMERFETDRKDPLIEEAIRRDLAEGNRVGVRGTPSVFINGKKAGSRSLEAFSSMIEEELDRADVHQDQ